MNITIELDFFPGDSFVSRAVPTNFSWRGVGCWAYSLQTKACVVPMVEEYLFIREDECNNENVTD